MTSMHWKTLSWNLGIARDVFGVWAWEKVNASWGFLTFCVGWRSACVVVGSACEGRGRVCAR